MHHHRFTDQLTANPPAALALPTAQGFMLCPPALQQGWQGQACPWQRLYEIAFAQAQAVVRPSRLERYQRNLRN